MIEQLKQLAALRKDEQELSEMIADLQKALNETDEAKALENALNNRKAIREQTDALTEAIKSEAVEVFKSTKEKPTIKGIGIKIFKVLQYNKSDAENWARKEMPVLFSFNEKAFEKYAKDFSETNPVPGVTIVEDPRAEISSDLSEYLE